MATEREDVEVASRAQWRAWLAEHAGTSDGCWAVTWRSGSGGPVVPYADLVEEALCVGWVDSRARGVDERRTALLFTPRRSGSGWSRPNKERVARLEAAGLLLPSGRAVIDAARTDGSWSSLDSAEALEVPSDLAAALDARPGARAAWDGFPRTTRRAVLVWIGEAARPATRGRRVTETAERAARGERAR